jgi:SAM-dependent methyltransferase
MKDWHQDDDFWQTMAPYLFSHKRWEEASGEIDEVLRLTQIPAGSRVLDLCCGPGRHSLELARRGFRVTAVDRSAEYLDRAGVRAEEEGLEIEFVQEDMRRFQRPSAFHLALNLYTSFGYFKDPQEDWRVGQNLCASLKPGGKLVMEMMSREVLTRIFRERDWQPTDDGGFFLEERKPSPDWTWMDNRWILVKDGQVEEFHISLRLYGASELAALLRKCGFGDVKLFGSLGGTPYDHTAKRLAILAVK